MQHTSSIHPEFPFGGVVGMHGKTGRMVLYRIMLTTIYTCYHGLTWEWDGEEWQQTIFEEGAGDCKTGKMIYDPVRETMLVLLKPWLDPALRHWRLREYVEFTPPDPADFSCASVGQIPQTECEALVALYHSTDGAGWSKNSGWLVTDTPCSWYGVRCGAGRVALISMTDNLLNGHVPSELGNLTNLQALILDYNRLSGSLPTELGSLVNMKGLYLNNNPLTGALPKTLANLNSLVVLYFQDTGLCEPGAKSFQNWLDSIYILHRTGVICGIQTTTPAPTSTPTPLATPTSTSTLPTHHRYLPLMQR